MIAFISLVIRRLRRQFALMWRACFWFPLIRSFLIVLNYCLLAILWCLYGLSILLVVSVYIPFEFVLYLIVVLCSVVAFGFLSPVESLYKKRFFR